MAQTQERNTQTQAPNEETSARPRRTRRSARSGRNAERPSRRARRGRSERARAEFDHTLLDVRRVARVVAGGRRFSFWVAVVVGDRKGRVGVGTGKGQDTALALEKALRDAKKHLLTVPRTAEGSLPHEVEAKYKAARVVMRPAPGRGLVAGSAVRVVLEFAGLTDVSAKLHSRTKNKVVVARAALAALRSLVPSGASEKRPQKASGEAETSAAAAGAKEA